MLTIAENIVKPCTIEILTCMMGKKSRSLIVFLSQTVQFLTETDMSDHCEAEGVSHIKIVLKVLLFNLMNLLT